MTKSKRVSPPRTCIICHSTSHTNYAGPKCVNCYRKDNPQVVEKIKSYQRANRKAIATNIGNRYAAARLQAKNRGIFFSLTKDEYTRLSERACFYCGSSISTGVGLDRIDNNKKVGYVLTNVLPCCGICNSIRGDKLSVGETLSAVDAVRQHRVEALKTYHEQGYHVDWRSVYIFGEVNSDMATRVSRALAPMLDISNAPIQFNVMSDGGDFHAALGIYDIIKNAPCETIGVGTGLIASSATVIFQAFSKRIVTEHCTFMVHDGEYSYTGQPKSFESWGLLSKVDREKTYQIYAERSGKDATFWEKACAVDTFYRGQEVVDVGLADAVNIKSKKDEVL